MSIIELENAQNYLSRSFGFVKDYPVRIYINREVTKFINDNQLGDEYNQLISTLSRIKNGNYVCRRVAKNNSIAWQIVDFNDNEKLVFEKCFNLGVTGGFEFELWFVEIKLKNKEGVEFRVMSLSLPLVENNLISR